MMLLRRHCGRTIRWVAGVSATTLSTTYDALVASGRLRQDASQSSAMRVLCEFARLDDQSSPAVYLWGSVGSGKSMLMDLLVGACAEHGQQVQRVHFHELMVDVHTQLHELHQSRPKTVVLTKQGLPMYKYGDLTPPRGNRAAADGLQEGLAIVPASSTAGGSAGGASGADTAGHPPESRQQAVEETSEPLSLVCATIASRGRLLCLDEMQVTDVADAMLLRQLFEGLFARGVRVVFTSNRPPEELYERGLNRKYFLPFVALLRSSADVVRVGEAGDDAIDYRALPPTSSREDGSMPVADVAPLPAASERALAHRPRGELLCGLDADATLRQRWQEHVRKQRLFPKIDVVSIAFKRRNCQCVSTPTPAPS